MPQVEYETERLLGQYLHLHYGENCGLLPAGLHQFVHSPFPVRVLDILDRKLLPENGTAVDLGCAVGRTTFELAKCCSKVLGVDMSARFIHAAQSLQSGESINYELVREGDIVDAFVAHPPSDVEFLRVSFVVGDACEVLAQGRAFDVVVAINLLCRLPEPMRLLEKLYQIVAPGGQLILGTPCSWKEEFTEHERWLCSKDSSGQERTTFDQIKKTLSPHFSLSSSTDCPFLIPEHSRFYQLGISQLSNWVRK